MRTATFPVEPGIGLVVTVENGVPVAVSTNPTPWWNNIRRTWMVTGPDGEAVVVDPQPAPLLTYDPAAVIFSLNGERMAIPPAVKVSA